MKSLKKLKKARADVFSPGGVAKTDMHIMNDFVIVSWSIT